MVKPVSPVRLFEGVERFGLAPALVSEDGAIISYAELAARADGAANAIGPERALVTVEMHNDIEPIVFYIGALRAGHVVIPNAGAGTLAEIEATFAPNASYALVNGNWQLIRASAERIEMSPELAILLSTSGSTGSSKFVRLSHRNLSCNALAIADYLELAPGERAITSLPAYYSYGLSILHTHLLFGHTLMLDKRSVSDPEFLQRVARERVTSLAGVPHTYQLLERSGFLEGDYPDLRYLTQAGGKLSRDSVSLFAQWAERKGKRYYVMYGQTEAAPRIAYLPPADALAHADCIGMAVPGGALRLEAMADAAGLPAGAGELVYKGPNVMMGYARSRADLTLPQGPDEIRTGDIAVCNAQGYYRIVGRLSRFAKLFGLRIGFDEIETRLAAAGIGAAVCGNDTGLVVAVTRGAAQAHVRRLLAEELGLPARLISVIEVDEIPRLPSGKTDYETVRRLGQKPLQTAPSSLTAAIAAILNEDHLDPRLSFSELGGDSLNYVQVVLTLETYLGQVPENWENTPIGELAGLTAVLDPGAPAARISGSKISLGGLDLARSVAIFLALMTHAFSQVGFLLPPELSFLARTATPMLILLFGVMIALLHAPRSAQSDRGDDLQNYLTKSLQCYVLYALNVLVIWLTAPAGWLYALGSLALLGAMPYAQILVFYTLMFLLLPALLFALKHVRFSVLFAASLTVHLSFAVLKAVPEAPLLAGQPFLQRLLDLLVGVGTAPQVAGPSLLHSFVLLLAGYWTGRNIRLSSERAAPRWEFIRREAPVAALFLAGCVLAFHIPGYPVDWEGLVGMQLRNLNHPAYIFVFGAVCIVLLSLLLVVDGAARAPGWLMAIGRRSLFGFGIGNAVIVLWPQGGLPFLTPLLDGIILLLFLVLLVQVFDAGMRAGRGGHTGLRWIYETTHWGNEAVAALARFAVRLMSGRPATLAFGARRAPPD